MSVDTEALRQLASRDTHKRVADTPQARRWLSPTFHLFLLLVSLSLFRVYALEVASRELLDCKGCLSSQSIVFELRFLLIAVSLHLLGHVWINRPLRFVIRLMVCSLLLLYVADLVLLKELHVRLTLHEIRQFSGQFASVGGYVNQVFGQSPALILIILCFGTVLLRYLGCRQVLNQSPALPLFVTICCVVIAGYAEPVGYHLYYLQNPIEAFIETATRKKPYSHAFQVPAPKDFANTQ